MHYAVLYFQETKMHEVPSDGWAKDYLQTLERVLLYVSLLPKAQWIDAEKLTQAGWDLAVGLEYLQMRVPEIEFKNRYPNLNAVMSKAREDSDFRDSEPKL